MSTINGISFNRVYSFGANGKRRNLQQPSREMVEYMSVQTRTRPVLSTGERAYLSMGLNQPGGKLPIFDETGQTIPTSIVKRCIQSGYAERWFANPMKPDWLVCRLTDAGRQALR